MERTSGSTSSTDAGERLPARVVLGRVVGAHGLRGQLHVRHFGGDPENLVQSPVVWLAADEDDPQAVCYEILRVGAGRSGEVRIALAGIEDREAAVALCGRLVMVEADQLAPLPPGEYYSYQLVGCRVEGEDGRPIGTVREVWSTGAPDILIVEGEAGEQHLIPAAEGLLREVDVDGRRIVIEVLPGLLDTA